MAVLVAIGLLPLVGILALVLDGGILMGTRRQAQAVADSVAYAAAYKLATADSSSARTAGLSIASINGYANDGTTSTVTLNIPPGSGANAGKTGYVEAIVTYKQRRFFSAIWSSSKVTVSARAVGQGTSTAGSPASVILTDPHMDGALYLTGSARLTTNAVIQVNSDSMYSSSNPSKGAVNASNGAYVTDTGGVKVVGNLNIPSYATPTTFFKNAPTTGASTATDPLASLSPPSTSTLNTIDKSKIPSSQSSAPYPPGGKYTLSPGIYNGGLKLDSGGVKYTMTNGIYYMQGGGFLVSNGTSLTDNGAGVLIYLDSSGGSLSYQGGTTVTLSSMTSGPYKGVVYYQDRANTSSLNNIANGSTVNMTGTIYAPNAALAIAGGASGASYGTQLIVKSLNLSNGVNINVTTPSTAPAAAGTATFQIVE